jgi:hypothetical protein
VFGVDGYVIAARASYSCNRGDHPMDLSDIPTLATKALNRRKFLKGTGMAGLGIASATLVGGSLSSLVAQSPLAQNKLAMDGSRKTPTTIHDTPSDIFTAALVAEDLATTFYYNALVGPVIMDPNLAGPGPSPQSHRFQRWKCRLSAGCFLRGD